jgi:hypothetical protein
MGATVSSASATSINQLLQQQDNVCTQTQTVNQTSNCPAATIACSNFVMVCENYSSIKQTCTMSQTTSMAQQAMTRAGSMATGGAWGISIADSTAVSQNLIQNFMTQMCDNTITAQQNIVAPPITCEEGAKNIYLQYINKYTSSTACAMTQFSKTSQSAAATSSAVAKGYDPLADLMIIGVFLVLLIVGVALVFGIPKKGGGQSTVINSSVQQQVAPPLAQ